MTHIDPRLHNANFLFREIEIRRILAQWQAGDSVLLTGIRRTGKSELMKAALYRYAKEGKAVVYLDVQAEDNLARFYQNLLTALIANMPPSLREKFGQAFQQALRVPDSLLRWLGGHIGKVNFMDALEIEFKELPEVQDEQLLRYWKPITEQIALQIQHCGAADFPVVGIDELPFMLENLLAKGVPTQELVLMLASLRTLRDAGLRLIIGGSISFENLLLIHRIPHTILGGLFRLPVAPFTRDEAQQYLAQNLAGTFAASPAAIALVLERLPDYVPEVLKIAKGFLVTCRDLADCAQCLQKEVMPGIRRAFIEQFSERFNKNYTPDELSCANQILDLIAQGPIEGVRLDGQRLPSGYQQVLSRLQYDNFIIDAPDHGWCFSLVLIRLWWRATRGMA